MGGAGAGGAGGGAEGGGGDGGFLVVKRYWSAVLPV